MNPNSIKMTTPFTTYPSSIKTRFALKFIQSMKTLNNNNRSSNNHKINNIRAAAYASMASAVGPRKAWSRALLRKVKNRTLNRFFTNRNRNRNYRSNYRIRIRSRRRGLPAGKNPREVQLRELVPGGQEMTSCSLLKETAHYIKCLTAQVQVMTTILDHYQK